MLENIKTDMAIAYQLITGELFLIGVIILLHGVIT